MRETWRGRIINIGPFWRRCLGGKSLEKFGSKEVFVI